MVDKDPESDPVSPGSAQPTARSRQPRRWLPWLLVAAVALLIGGGLLVALLSGPRKRPEAEPLVGELTVLIRPAGSSEMIAIEDSGAVPVRAGARMSLQIDFNQPMYAYLVWLDSQGQVVPLYPWNNDRVEVVDLNQPPPTRTPAKVVMSPSVGGGWVFGQRGGMEAVLVLARR